MNDQTGRDVVDEMPLRLERRIALVGGFRPRKCGIATFTTDVFEQLGEHHPELQVDVYAMRNAASPDVDREAYALIDEQDRSAYLAAARRMNEDAVDAVWVQHEFGIFGGNSGEWIIDLIDRVAAPVIVTLHTILADPSDIQRDIVLRIIAKASRLVVMSEHGRRLLCDVYGADERAVAVIEHGAPDRPFGRQVEFKEILGHADRRILMTFGLLGPGKGLETALRALPQLVKAHPDLLYRIVGATHPNLVEAEGEAYRESLCDLADRLGVSDHVEWDDRFLSNEELLDQLEACDIYLTPYPNLQQSTSGTLSYAVALGKAVVSTPYIHARELLADDKGIFIEPGDADAIAQAVGNLLDDPKRMKALQKCAYSRGRDMIWPRFAGRCAALVSDVVSGPRGGVCDDMIHAEPGLTGLWIMCDSTGIMQHGIGMVPDRHHGYCLDDNVRALMFMNMTRSLDNATRLQWSSTFASFIQHGWNPEKHGFRNFMAFDRSWNEELGSEDSNGRAFWALGHTARYGVSEEMRDWALYWFDRAGPSALRLESPRAIAFAMLGACNVLAISPEHGLAREIAETGGDLLQKLLTAAMRPDWTWFEAVLGYDNPRLAEALLMAGVTLGNADWRDEALDALKWICGNQIGANGHFRPVGSDTFGLPHENLPFDQQPLEAWAAIDACLSAYGVTRDPFWVRHAKAAYGWYFGANDRGVLLADISTGFCRDGITAKGANANRGAESLLAFQLAHIATAGIMALAEDRQIPGVTDGDKHKTEIRLARPA